MIFVFASSVQSFVSPIPSGLYRYELQSAPKILCNMLFEGTGKLTDTDGYSGYEQLFMASMVGSIISGFPTIF